MPRDKYQYTRPEIVAMYDRLLAEQGGKCAIRGCDRTPKTRRFHIDHDHATGKVRGLLCHWHNRIMPKDSREARMLASYLATAERKAERAALGERDAMISREGVAWIFTCAACGWKSPRMKWRQGAERFASIHACEVAA